MDPLQIDSAAQVYRNLVEADDLRGALLLVARHGQVVLFEPIGWRDRENGLPYEDDTLFRMASNTKPVIATAALILQEEGQLSLEDPVSRYIPEFENGEMAAITISHLLSHTSGLPRSPIFLSGVESGTSLTREAERFATEVSLDFPPGTDYGYSNAGYNTLGAIIEIVSEQPLEDFLSERIYEPLGMVDSSNYEATADQSRMGKIYRPDRDEGGWRTGWKPGDGPDYPIVRASGGMISTAWDYAIFLQSWLQQGSYGTQRLLSPASVSDAIAPLTRDLVSSDDPNDGETFYGLGWQVMPAGVFGHSGSDGTFAWADPDFGIIGIVFTQSPGGENPRLEFIRKVRNAVVE